MQANNKLTVWESADATENQHKIEPFAIRAIKLLKCPSKLATAIKPVLDKEQVTVVSTLQLYCTKWITVPFLKINYTRRRAERDLTRQSRCSAASQRTE